MESREDVAPTVAPDQTPAPPKSNRSALLIVFLVIFIDLLGFGIVIPMLSLDGRTYIEALLPTGTGETGKGIILGLLMSAFSAMQFLFAPLWGRTSDKVGRRPILQIGLTGSVLFYCLFGYALQLGPDAASLAMALLFLARIGAGVFGATIPTAQAVIADCTPPEHRKHGMALVGAAFGLGFAFGPILGFGSLYLFPQHPQIIGYVAAGLSGIALILCYVLFRETRQFGGPTVTRKWFSWTETREVLATPTVGLLVIMFFLTTMGFGSFEPTLALFNEDILRVGRENNYLIFSYVGFVLLVTQGYIYRKAAKVLPEESLMTIGITLMGSGLAFLGVVVYGARNAFFPSWDILFTCAIISLTLSVVGFGFLTPSIQALISRRSDSERQGEVLGVNQSASALARILGPLIGLALYFAHPSRLLPYAFGAVVLLSMLCFLPRIRKFSST
jgi:DHA1 family tetracycline resistance protein-like MFS transporter